MLFSDYARRYLDGLELYKQYCQAACELGAKILVMHGDRLGNTRITDNEYFERFDKLTKIGQSFDVTVAQENVFGYKSSNVDFIFKMKKNLPNVKFVFDVKQELRAGCGKMNMARAMGESICHTHINDSTNEKDCLLPFDGDGNYSPLFNLLKSIHYKGAVIIEVYRNNFKDTNDLVRSYKLLSERNENL